MTPPARITGGRAMRPLCAIQAPMGATASANPKKKCVAAVNRLVSEYKKITTKATGASAKVSRLMQAAAKMKPAELSTNHIKAVDFAMSRCRTAVRGLRWSSDQSTNRLKSMAAVRARTMQINTNRKILQEGHPFAATKSAPKAKGRAKIVCEKRINRKKRENDPPSASLDSGC